MLVWSIPFPLFFFCPHFLFFTFAIVCSSLLYDQDVLVLFVHFFLAGPRWENSHFFSISFNDQIRLDHEKHLLFRGRGRGGGCRCIGSRRPAGDRLIQCARMATITFNPIDSGNTRPSFKVHTTLATRENKRKCMCDAQRGVHHRSS